MSTSPRSSDSDNQTQRFFSQGKRIPKDVKRHCGMCKQHGVIVETRGHTCEYKNCSCEQCELVRRRREIMSTQIRLRREQDKKFQRTNDASEADIVPWAGEIGEDKVPENINMCYFCQKCKNHGILMWKKEHKKKCQFNNCRCEQCDLIDSRRALDRHIKKRKIGMKDGTESKSPKKDGLGSNCSSEESSSSSESSSSGNNTSVPSFNFLTGSGTSPYLQTNGTTSPALSSPFEASSPVNPLSASSIPSTTPIPLNFLAVPSLIPQLAQSAFSPMIPSSFPLFANPFLMTAFPQFDMQMILALQEMTASVNLSNSDC